MSLPDLRRALFVGASLLVLVACTARPIAARRTMKDTAAPTFARLADGVEKRVLDNGLTVLFKRNTAAPVVAIVTHVKAGYFDEPDEVAGISHVIEHMFFNGTPTRPGAEDISRETKALGGQLNAGTIYDRTTYHVVLPSEHFKEGLEIQADAFQNPLFDEAVLAKEKEAILQEARRKLDNPPAFAREKMFELAFDQHRMRRWRIGDEETIRGMTRDQLVDYYQQYYRPSNTILSIVGNVTAEEAFSQVERLYGGQPGRVRRDEGPSEPEQKELRYQRRTGDVIRFYAFVGFHTPGVLHKDNAALDVLSTILGTGRSSRLNARLKEDLGLVTNVGAGTFQFDDVGMFNVNFVLPLGDNLDRALRETFVTLREVQDFGVDESELERARGIVQTSRALEMEEVLGQASTLAYYEAEGDYRRADEELEDIAAVTAEDVQRVARQYLTLENATILEYCPAGIPEGEDAATMAGHLNGAILAAAAEMEAPQPVGAAPTYMGSGELADWSKRLADAQGQGVHPVQRFDMPRGSVLLVRENHSVPTVAVTAYFRGGRLDETVNTSGLARMLQRVMVKETGNRTPEQLAYEIESLGTTVGQISNDDYFGFSVNTLAASFPRAFDVMFDVMSNPHISEEQVQIEAEVQRSAIVGQYDQTSTHAHLLLREALYGRHPYGLSPVGNEAVMRYVTHERLRDLHAEIVRPEAMVISVAGAVNAELAAEFIGEYLRLWSVAGKDRPQGAEAFYTSRRFEEPEALAETVVKSVRRDRSQSALMLAYPTVPVNHPDNYPLEVLQSITGGLGGTFFEEIRTKRGLAYQVSTFDVSHSLGGFFGSFVACTPDSARVVEDLLLEQFAELTEEAPPANAIERAKAHLTGSYVSGLQTNGAQAGELGRLELFGADLSEFDEYPQRIQAVTTEDLLRVAKTYFAGKPHALARVSGVEGSTANP